ncbi:PEPxxWA-CTERM sorting domain-containing protein [Phenylobacterium sp.]|uniref:PEPxxWA-CTERM sorting domain-containing protein n=1 Tax=Phenylobacterium sp. TaxID=1871053 RepID=UPI0025CEF8B9|nr:PEPxxWA-CTERM sorting domain-containing protein [Phenylobacterium sp.]
MDNKLAWLAVTALGVAALAGSNPAAAQAAYGSAAFASYRDCSAAGAGACDGTVEPAQAIVGSAISGGLSSTSNTNLTLTGQTIVNLFGNTVTLPNDPASSASGTVGFGAADLPVLKAASSSGAETRMGINAFGYQSYTNEGASSTPFEITGNLDIDSFSGTAGGVFPGGAIATTYVALWDPSVISSLGPVDAQTLFDDVFLTGCGTPGVLGVAFGGGTLVGSGSPSISTTTEACSGSSVVPGPITLGANQTVLVVAGLQLLTNRGGVIDALDTFTTEFTPDAGVDVAELRSGESILGVPEPASWALMLGGFFGLGGALRRRRTALAV